MKEQELLFLGFLQDGPKHGYQLKKMHQEISETFAGLRTYSIYYPLQKMLKSALVTQTKAKEGKWPVRYLYAITAKGQQEFKKMLLKNMLKVERPYFSIDLSLYFSKYIPPDVRDKYLRIRLKLLNRLDRAIRKLKASLADRPTAHLALILDHNQRLLQAEIDFILSLVER